MDILQQNRFEQIREKFLSSAAPQKSFRPVPQIQIDILREKSQVDYEKPAEYYSALWSMPHAKPTQTKVKIQVQGSVVRVMSHSTKAEKGKTFERDWDQCELVAAPLVGAKGNKRDITEFSKSSRRNFMDKMLSLKPESWDGSQFLTVTYHDNWFTPKIVKSHLRTLYKRVVRFSKRFTKKAYKPAMFWHMERQKRGAPHFHLFLFNSPEISSKRLLRWWQEITTDRTIEQCKSYALDSRRKAMNYLTKYVAKVPPQDAEGGLLDVALYWAEGGRWWGSEGLTDDMFAPINELVCTITDDGLKLLIQKLEVDYPFLLDRWSFGFRVFTLEGAADSIYELAALLINGEVINNLPVGGLHSASSFQ